MKKLLLVICLLCISLLLLGLSIGLYLGYPRIQELNSEITRWFEGKRWELPARIYARPLEIYTGTTLVQKDFKRELQLLGYTETEHPAESGEFFFTQDQHTVCARKFHFPDGFQEARCLKITTQNNIVTIISDLKTNQEIDIFRLEPLHYASIYPKHNEDRLLLTLDECPKQFQDILLLVEDQGFYNHHGIDIRAIVRAAIANLRAGKTVQGGSTLTQQLVKNIFLTSEKSYSRKINETIMALLLERSYSKKEILETYINEVYLGQDGKRAIHGFGMASHHYFNKNLEEITVAQMALLVGMVKGASYYNPRLHPERAKLRRDNILDKTAVRLGLDKPQLNDLKDSELEITSKPSSSNTMFPAFLQLVRKQLKQDYKDEDLQNEGLSIYTTLDPVIQLNAEQSLQTELTSIETKLGKETGELEGATVIATVHQGEIVAVVGSRTPQVAGFNRALDMQRPIGSIIKPAVYLTSLLQPKNYNLLSQVEDAPVKVSVNNKLWSPDNYDHTFHGKVPLIKALAHSYNGATVHLGLELGLGQVLATIKKLGIKKSITPYPSVLLGAVELPPIEVLQMYQTLAAGGYMTPLRAILTVTDIKQNPLQRYPLAMHSPVEPNGVYCITRGMQEVVRSGTARSLKKLLPKGSQIAGKTGTTNNLRDSWFAGFSGSHVAVSWVGRDDNKPSGLTGATGGLKVWGATMAKISMLPLELEPLQGIDHYYTDISKSIVCKNQQKTKNKTVLPFIKNGVLPEVGYCETDKKVKQPAKPRTIKTEKSIQQVFKEGWRKLLKSF